MSKAEEKLEAEIQKKLYLLGHYQRKDDAGDYYWDESKLHHRVIGFREGVEWMKEFSDQENKPIKLELDRWKHLYQETHKQVEELTNLLRKVANNELLGKSTVARIKELTKTQQNE